MVVESRIGEMYTMLPMIHFKPVEAKKSKAKGMYACPLYLYPLRTGSRERPSFMLPLELKAGTVEPEAKLSGHGGDIQSVRWHPHRPSQLGRTPPGCPR